MWHLRYVLSQPLHQKAVCHTRCPLKPRQSRESDPRPCHSGPCHPHLHARAVNPLGLSVSGSCSRARTDAPNATPFSHVHDSWVPTNGQTPANILLPSVRLPTTTRAFQIPSLQTGHLARQIFRLHSLCYSVQSLSRWASLPPTHSHFQ